MDLRPQPTRSQRISPAQLRRTAISLSGAVIGTGVGVLVASALVVTVKVGRPFLRGFRSGWHRPDGDTPPDGDPTPITPPPTQPAAAALAAGQPIGMATAEVAA